MRGCSRRTPRWSLDRASSIPSHFVHGKAVSLSNFYLSIVYHSHTSRPYLDLCYNFVYRPCTTVRHIFQFKPIVTDTHFSCQGMHLIIKYFVGGELGVANVLQRHFDWTSNALWYDEIPNARDRRRTMFFLGGKDDIICADVRLSSYPLPSHSIIHTSCLRTY